MRMDVADLKEDEDEETTEDAVENLWTPAWITGQWSRPHYPTKKRRSVRGSGSTENWRSNDLLFAARHDEGWNFVAM